MAATNHRRTRVLILAHHTADSPSLVRVIAQRARREPCTFTLLVPAAPAGLERAADPGVHGTADAEARLDRALPLLSAVVGSDVAGMVGSPDPLAAVQDALSLLGFDEVIISMLPARVSRWLRLDLPRKVQALG